MINSYPSDKFVFIVGADTLEHVKDWEDSERVVREVRFAVARRRGLEAPADPRLGVSWFDLDAHQEASSRDIRDELRVGKQPGHLDPRVYAYITEQSLYIEKGDLS